MKGNFLEAANDGVIVASQKGVQVFEEKNGGFGLVNDVIQSGERFAGGRIFRFGGLDGRAGSKQAGTATPFKELFLAALGDFLFTPALLGVRVLFVAIAFSGLADLLRGVRLQVEGVRLGRPSPEKHEDQPGAGGGVGSSAFLGAQEAAEEHRLDIGLYFRNELLLILERAGKTSSGIPLLSKIPILGAAFGTQHWSRDRTELVLLITPGIVSDILQAREATQELRKKLPMLEGFLPKPVKEPVAEPVRVLPAEPAAPPVAPPAAQPVPEPPKPSVPPPAAEPPRPSIPGAPEAPPKPQSAPVSGGEKPPS